MIEVKEEMVTLSPTCKQNCVQNRLLNFQSFASGLEELSESPNWQSQEITGEVRTARQTCKDSILNDEI